MKNLLIAFTFLASLNSFAGANCKELLNQYTEEKNYHTDLIIDANKKIEAVKQKVEQNQLNIERLSNSLKQPDITHSKTRTLETIIDTYQDYIDYAPRIVLDIKQVVYDHADELELLEDKVYSACN